MGLKSSITAKGQTTIPKPIRDHLALKTGDRIEYLIKENGKVEIIPINVDVEELAGILPKPKKKVSLEEIDKAIRKRIIKKCKD